MFTDLATTPQPDLHAGAADLACPVHLIHSRFDLSAPPDTAWDLSRAYPDATLTLLDGGLHGAGTGDMRRAIRAATDALHPGG